MKHIFIVNPKAGHIDSTDRISELICETMAGRDYEIVKTEYPCHATEIAKSYCESGEEVSLYACGGDGTLNEVVCGAAGYNNARVAHVPCGTGNDFLKLIGLEDIERCKTLRDLVDGDVYTCDLIDINGRHSVNIANMGFDAKVANTAQKVKKFPLIKHKAAYDLGVVLTLVTGLNQKMKVNIDGEEFEGKFCFAVCCNGRFYGGGYMPVLEAMPDDGILEFMLIKKVSLFEVAKLIGPYSRGERESILPWIEYRRGTSMTVKSDSDITLSIDGEILKYKEIRAKLSDKKVNILLPSGARFLSKPKTLQKV